MQKRGQPGLGLGNLQRVCVAEFSGEQSLVAPVREIAIASLYSLKRFVVTENCGRADATLKGAVVERIGGRARSEGESTDFGLAGGGGSVSGGSGAAGFGAILGSNTERLSSAETTTRATVAMRLVSNDGDVLWAFTQDSPGGKTKGAIADAVDRAIRQLSRDLTRSGATPAVAKD